MSNELIFSVCVCVCVAAGFALSFVGSESIAKQSFVSMCHGRSSAGFNGTPWRGRAELEPCI